MSRLVHLVLMAAVLAVATGAEQMRFRARFESQQVADYSPFTLPTAFVVPSYSLPVGCENIAYNATPTGGCKILVVNSGESIQTAVDGARCNGSVTDMITIEKYGGSVSFNGVINLDAKSGCNDYLYIVTSGVANLPTSGNRLVPNGVTLPPSVIGQTVAGNTSRDELARIVVPDGIYSAIDTEFGASYYRFVGIEVLPAPSTVRVGQLVALSQDNGAQADTAAEEAHHIIFDRCYIHSDAGSGSQAGAAIGVAWVGHHLAVVDSTILNIYTLDNNETKAILPAYGAQYLTAQNNILEATGENILSAAQAPYDSNQRVSDMVVRGNYFWKRTDPWQDNPSTYSVKNLYENKSCVRCLVKGNVMVNTWVDDQETAISLKVGEETSNELTQDVTFVYNIIIGAANGIKFCKSDCGAVTPGVMNRIFIAGNLWRDVDKDTWGPGSGHGAFIFLLVGQPDLIIDHNTVECDGGAIPSIILSEGQGTDFVLTNNITCDMDGTPLSAARIATAHSSYTFSTNLLVGSGTCPGSNACPAAYSNVGFVNQAGGNFALDSGSAYKGTGTNTYQAGTTDPGANITNLNIVTACAVSGQCAGGPPAPEPFWLVVGLAGVLAFRRLRRSPARLEKP